MTTSSNTVERKTDTNEKNANGDSKNAQISKGKKTKKKLLPNVLNNYRNLTYSFTFSAVPDEWLDDAKYRIMEPKFIILKSGGKGTKDFAIPGSLSAVQKNLVEETAYDTNFGKVSQQSLEEYSKKELSKNQDIVTGFNKSSPGRFDMFIDDIDIRGIMTPGTSNGASLATKMSFSVMEPYSINGFIEALHAASIAAGYVTYASAAFLMRIDFWGYPDDVDVSQSSPVKIDQATKFLLLGLSSVKVELTEKGTKYQCSAVMFTDRGLGNPNKLKKPISMQGSTVKEILTDLCNNLEKQVADSDNDSRPSQSKNHDKYEIKFPMLEDGQYKFSDENNIGKSKISDFNKSNVLSSMPDPGAKEKTASAEEVKQDPNKLKYSPNSSIKVQFNAGRNLNECIEAVIVDSEYVKGLLENFKPDENGLVNYFLIIPEVTNLSTINPQTKDYYKKYTFIITEYKIHYTRVPGYQSIKFDTDSISNIIYKEYNYTYTGKNIDVLNFRLDFNNLYYESIPFALANNNFPGVRNSAVNDDAPKVEYASEPVDRVAAHPLPLQPTRFDVSSINPNLSGTGGQLTDDPYQILARNLHEAVINAGVSGAMGTLEILGDPFYISTTGTGNYKAKLKDGYLNVTTDNEIDSSFGEVYIIIIFRNPVDVNQFDKNRAPFSGVYMITEVTSTFKGGVFKQEFKLIRIPAQIPIDDNMKSTDVNSISVTSPDPTNQVVPDSTPSISGPGLRPDPTQLSIPTVNNPVYNLVGKLVNPVSQGISQLSAASSIYSLATSRLTEGIRLASTTINDSMQKLSSLKAAGEALGSAVGKQSDAVDNVMSSFSNNPSLSSIVKGFRNTNELVGGLANKLKGPTKEQALEKLANTLGIKVNDLTALGEEKLKNLKDNAADITVNIIRAADSGIKLDNVPIFKIANIPAIPPPTTAPQPDIPLADLNGLDIAKAFGVTSLEKLPGNLTPEKINSAIAAGPGIAGKFLAGKNALMGDLSSVRNKLDNVSSNISNALGSPRQALESAQKSVGILNTKSVSNLFGSNSSSSPLDKLIVPPNQDNLG